MQPPLSCLKLILCKNIGFLINFLAIIYLHSFSLPLLFPLLILTGGQRNWVQVICNGGVACVAALCYVGWREGHGELPFYLSSSSPPSLHTLAAMACLSALSCCCGDTWASEVGSVLGGTPRLLTTWKKVPQGTNGGVTLVGITCSLLGGVVVGGAYYIGLFVLVRFESLGDAMSQSVVILLGGMAGLIGSLVDSFLGATVQYSGFSEIHKCVVHRPGGNEEDDGDRHVKHISGIDVLDNHAVNFMSSIITAVVVPLVAYAVCITWQIQYIATSNVSNTQLLFPPPPHPIKTGAKVAVSTIDFILKFGTMTFTLSYS